MSLHHDPHQDALRSAGWYSRGYLPHFDGRRVPQFLTFRLAGSVPTSVINAWKRELNLTRCPQDQLFIQRRIESYLDLGYGDTFLKHANLAEMIQQALLADDYVKYRLSAWVVMPNHVHLLATRSEGYSLAEIVQSFKSLTSHKANKALNRSGPFWMPDYFDRYIRSEEHFHKTVRYIEKNPVKAGLCSRPGDWPFSSAWFRERFST